MRTCLSIGLCALACAIARPLWAVSRPVDSVRLRVAVMSDVHLHSEPRTDETLRKALVGLTRRGSMRWLSPATSPTGGSEASTRRSSVPGIPSSCEDAGETGDP